MLMKNDTNHLFDELFAGKNIFLNFPPEFNIEEATKNVVDVFGNHKRIVLVGKEIICDLRGVSPKEALRIIHSNMVDLLCILNISPFESVYAHWIEILLQSAANRVQIFYAVCFHDLTPYATWLNKICRPLSSLQGVSHSGVGMVKSSVPKNNIGLEREPWSDITIKNVSSSKSSKEIGLFEISLLDSKKDTLALCEKMIEKEKSEYNANIFIDSEHRLNSKMVTVSKIDQKHKPNLSSICSNRIKYEKNHRIKFQLESPTISTSGSTIQIYKDDPKIFDRTCDNKDSNVQNTGNRVKICKKDQTSNLPYTSDFEKQILDFYPIPQTNKSIKEIDSQEDVNNLGSDKHYFMYSEKKKLGQKRFEKNLVQLKQEQNIYFFIRSNISFKIVGYTPSQNPYLFELKLNGFVHKYICKRTIIITATAKICESTAHEIYKQRSCDSSSQYRNFETAFLLYQQKNTHDFFKAQNTNHQHFTDRFINENNSKYISNSILNVNVCDLDNSIQQSVDDFVKRTNSNSSHEYESFKDINKSLKKSLNPENGWADSFFEKKVQESNPKTAMHLGRINKKKLSSMSNQTTKNGQLLLNPGESSIMYDRKSHSTAFETYKFKSKFLEELVNVGICYITHDTDYEDKKMLIFLFENEFLDIMICGSIKNNLKCDTLIFKSTFQYESKTYKEINILKMLQIINDSKPKNIVILTQNITKAKYNSIFGIQKYLSLENFNAESDKSECPFILSAIENHFPLLFLKFMFYDHSSLSQLSSVFFESFFYHRVLSKKRKFPIKELLEEISIELQRSHFLNYQNSILALNQTISKLFFKSDIEMSDFCKILHLDSSMEPLWNYVVSTLKKSHFLKNQIHSNFTGSQSYIFNQKPKMSFLDITEISESLKLVVDIQMSAKIISLTPFIALSRFVTPNLCLKLPRYPIADGKICTNHLEIIYKFDNISFVPKIRSENIFFMESSGALAITKGIDRPFRLFLQKKMKHKISVINMRNYNESLFLVVENHLVQFNEEFHAKKRKEKKIKIIKNGKIHENYTITTYTLKKNDFTSWFI